MGNERDRKAAPSIEERRIRRMLLPTVVPNPRSNGSTMKRPNVSLLDRLSVLT